MPLCRRISTFSPLTFQNTSHSTQPRASSVFSNDGGHTFSILFENIVEHILKGYTSLQCWVFGFFQFTFSYLHFNYHVNTILDYLWDFNAHYHLC